MTPPRETDLPEVKMRGKSAGFYLEAHNGSTYEIRVMPPYLGPGMNGEERYTEAEKIEIWNYTLEVREWMQEAVKLRREVKP